MKTILDADFSDKTVLLRADFNVPLDEEGKITDDLRIVSILPTIEYILQHGAKIILCSHLGRPDGKADPAFSLKPVAARLEQVIHKKVIFADDDRVTGEMTKKTVQQFKRSNDQLMLLQNIRFRKEEEKNDPAFSKELADLADIFVMDAFGCAHRAHASTVGVASYIPAYGGLLIEKEVRYLSETLENPPRPFTLILGGKKVSDKIGLIDNLLGKADNIIIGGAMAITFLKAQGYNTGTSAVETDKLELALQILQHAKEKNIQIFLPVDLAGSNKFSKDTPKKEYGIDHIPDDFVGLDIGGKTQKIFKDVIFKSKTIVFNGPMGVFEMANYEDGTKAVIQAMADFGGISVISGGDSAAAVSLFNMADKMTHVSTGGGASIELLEGKILPGIKIIL